MSYARSKNLTPYDVLTIASMIEREARVPGDRAKVSAVIYNRLHRGMPLGIDATILYHLGSWTATIHQSDLDDPEPYNTRIHKGLPPTPICNPGLASMQAAAAPRGQLPLLRGDSRQVRPVLHGRLSRLRRSWRVNRGWP